MLRSGLVGEEALARVLQALLLLAKTKEDRLEMIEWHIALHITVSFPGNKCDII